MDGNGDNKNAIKSDRNIFFNIILVDSSKMVSLNL